MSFNGDLYPTAGADVVMTTKGDVVRFDSERERYGIGSTGQVMAVSSGLPAWTTLSTADSVLTTQGDILYEGASALARLGQSTNFHTLATKGAGANPAWQASATSTMTAAQDILYSSSANTLARLAAGTDGDVLTTHSTGSAPTWETPAGGGQLELIDSDLTSAASIWNSSTFSANMKTTYSELIFIGNMYWKTGSGYTEFGDTYINLNGITSGYNAANGYYYDGTTMTQLTKSTTTVGFISDDAMDLSSGEGMHVETTLAQVDGTTNIISYHSICTSSTGTSMVLDTFLDIGSTDIITDVKLQASLAQWGTGSNFVIYGRKLT